MPVIKFDGFSVEAPPGWEDITDGVNADTPPPTLAPLDGVGALQFSVALYVGGTEPDPSQEELLQMLEEFAGAHDLGESRGMATELGPLRLAAASFDSGGDFVRVWQVFSGRSFALITCVCESGAGDGELADCERIVRSLQFDRVS